MKKTIPLILICLSFAAVEGWAQTGSGSDSNPSSASEKLALAIRLMDQGFYERSIALLDEADELDPRPTFTYLYEKACAYYMQGDPSSFESWHLHNAPALASFIEWFNANPIFPQ